MKIESKWFTLSLASITALTSLSIDMSLPAVPAIEHEFHLLRGQGSLTLSLFLAGYALTPLIGGTLADRLGRRPVLLSSLILFAASALTCTVSTSFNMLLWFRLIQGCASGVSTALPLSIVRDLLEGSMARRRISEITTINGVMPIVAPILGSWVMSAGHWRIVFGVQSIFATCIAIALYFEFEESLPLVHRQRLNFAQSIRNYTFLFTNRTFISYSLIYSLTFASMFSFISMSPLILMQRMGVERPTYTILFVIIATGTILGSFMSGVFSSRETRVHNIIIRGLICMSIASITAAVLQIAGFQNPITILPPVFLVLFGFGLAGPAVTLEALEPVPHLAGAGSGALRSILMVFGSGTSGLLASYCARHFVHAEVATTLTMATTALIALALYLSLLYTLKEHPTTLGVQS